MWKKLLYLMFIIWMSKPIQSAVLECSWDPEMLICTPYNITPVTQPNEVITINGKSEDFFDSTTTFVKFSNQVINHIPSRLLFIFPALQSLIMEQCETTTLTIDSIPNCGVLNTFKIVGGTFTYIPEGVLQSCKSLTNLGIDDNNVTTIDLDAFRGLISLKSVSITGTKISCLPPELFQNTPKLTTVNIYSNMIASIDSNLFVNLPLLQKVNLNNNLITYIPVLNLTASLTVFLNIDFGTNPIYAISLDICSTFTTESVTIVFSKIPCIPENSPANMINNLVCQNSANEFSNCLANWTVSMMAPVTCDALPPTTVAPTTMAPTTMEPTTLAPTTEATTASSQNPSPCPSDKICRYFLDQYNRYTCILDGVDSVLTSIGGNHLITFTDVDVHRVVFTNSFLSRIPPILFQKFASLEYLEAPNCSISVMNTNTFTECGNLRYFDAGYNLFTTVDGASLKSCAALEVIDLTGNKIDFISGQLFVNNPTLKTVYINKPPAIVLV